MKNIYISSLILGMMCFTIDKAQSQNILFDGDFSETTEIVPFDMATPPLNIWAYRVNENSGAEANPSVVDGVAKIQIQNPGYNYWDIELAQFGFLLTKGHIYNLSFNVKADTDRLFGVYLGEAGLNNNILGYSPPIYTANNEWKTIRVDFESNMVFDLHQLSFGIGADSPTIYFDNVALTDLGPSILTEVNLIGNLQEEMGCDSNNDSECEYSKLVLNTSSGLWEGSFFLPEGCYLYRVNEKFSYHEVPYGENGVEWGEDIQLYLPVDSEIKFSYDPTTHLISSTPFSGNSEELTEVSLIGNFQEEIGCNYDYDPDCEISTLEFNAESGMWEGSFVIPAGCYFYQVKEAFGCEEILYGENGLEGSMIELYVPSDGEVTFIYDPQTHMISSTPYSGVPQDVTKVSLVGSFQNEMGCEFDYDNFCDILELQFNSSSGIWEGSFTIPAGCYFYEVKETSACDFRFYGENGEQGGQNIPLYIPTESEILFSYDPQTHLIVSNPFSGIPQEITSVSLIGTLQDELGCSYDNDSECDKPALHLNPETGLWQGSFVLPEGCYTYMVKQKFACDAGVLYGAGGQESGDEIQLYVPSGGEITFSYDPETHMISSSPYGDVPMDMTKVSLIGSLQDELGCAYDLEEECESAFLEFNAGSGTWEGRFDLPKGCYTYRIREASVCGTIYYGSNGGEIQLFVPSNGEITFNYDPVTHNIETTPYTGVPDEVTKVSLLGSLQDELGCEYENEYDCDNSTLNFNSELGVWERTFMLPSGCYEYRVLETFGCDAINYYGENGVENGREILLYIPTDGEVTFTYDPETHLITSTPFSSPELSKVSLTGTIQDILCAPNYEECDDTELMLNSETGLWEGKFTLPQGCYMYQVKEITTCNEVFYGENGEMGGFIQLYLPSDAEISFSYDPQTHVLSSSPYSGAPQEVIAVSLEGSSLQNELFSNPDMGTWEGTFTLSPGCYTYRVKETFGCQETYYGENGNFWPEIQLYVPTEAEITFSYDPQTHLITSTPYIGNPQDATAVSLVGSLQNELGCDYDDDSNCDKPNLTFNPISGLWEGSFTLPVGCYSYRVKETSGCYVTYYGENGSQLWPEMEIYIPSEDQIDFSYDSQTHILTTSPYSGVPTEPSKVVLAGSFQNQLGCDSNYDGECENTALIYNNETGMWEGSFSLPAGCYDYWTEVTSACYETRYGEDGVEWGSISLYVPSEEIISFSYDPITHITISTPYSGIPQEATGVSLTGLPDDQGCTGEDDCDDRVLEFNPDSGMWEANFTLPVGCYFYRVKETSVCKETYYGENGNEWDVIELYVPADGEITFSYDPQTHIIISTPYSGVPEEVTNVNLVGSLEGQYGSIPLTKNQNSGNWEGTYMAPAGCYAYMVEEIIGCTNGTYYGENGQVSGPEIQLKIPSGGEITFTYDPETHLIISTPYSGAPQEVTKVSLTGSVQDELGCASNDNYTCDKPALVLNADSGMWEGSFTIPAGCYFYWVKETIGCNKTNLYGENGEIYGNYISLYVPFESELTFSFDPQTHIISSTPYFDISTANQCPENIYVNNTPGICGANIDYPEFFETVYCGGEILVITQTEGLPPGSLFPIGTTTNTFELVRTTGEVTTCSFDVVVTDTESPVIADLQENYEPLWPPNHKMVPLFMEYLALDNCNIASTELSISSNEPETGQGNGDLAPDWEILDEHNILLRAERSAKGDGREYYITIKVIDSSGNFTEQFVIVRVSHDKGGKSEELIIHEISDNKYILYPNAADEIINIKGPKPTSNSAYVIYDMLGVLKRQGTILNEQVEVETLPSGVYIFKFQTDSGYIFKKFIKN